jgi:hypothetical protein
MPSPDEMQSQSGKYAAADAADDDIVVVDEETTVREPGRGPWVRGGDWSSAPVTGAQPDWAEPTAGGEPGSMPPTATGESGGASAMAAGGPGSTPAPDDPGPRNGPLSAAGASPTAGGDASPLGGSGPRTAPRSARDDESAGPQAAGGVASMPGGAPGTAQSAPQSDRRWREIQAMFVDDPRDSVQRASDLIDTAIEEFLAAIRQRQAALASSWQNRDADTEALRSALKDYRALWAVVRDMPAVSVPGAAAAAGAGVGGSSFGAGPGGSAGPYQPERGGTPA